jgi:MHS family alpha-ketoglutarate permease-like MFS transporter
METFRTMAMDHAAATGRTVGSTTGASTADAYPDDRRRIWAIVGGSSGNLVEWYDFYSYAFAALFFAPSFFPKDDPTSQLLNTAGIFAAGFLVRPLGGWLFGKLADRKGRRMSMMVAMLIMCGGSLMIAVLPTYAAIGTGAPALLLLARLIQGVSVGGEYGISATYMSEVARSGRRGFLGSFQYVTLIGGQLLASLVMFVLGLYLSSDEMKAWGWRVPFVIGAAAAIVALFLRRSLHETTTAEDRTAQGAGTMAALWQHKRAIFTVLGFTAGGSLIFYTFTTYMQKYLVNTAGFTPKSATSTMTVVLLVYMLMQPPFGALADRIGRRNSMIAFGLLTAILVIPLMTALATVRSPFTAFLLITCGLAAVSLYTSISGLVKAELFPTSVRALGTGLTYGVANAIFGGSAEYVALAFKQGGHESYFYYYVAGMCALALVVALGMPDARRTGFLRHEMPLGK